ncbi:MAG: ABC transporter ATP-binding protein [Firmicutes bacterium]|nr:ABC transporter ATP-binding protein [Bacillota bacterium]
MIKKLAGSIRQYKLLTLLTPVCMILEVVMEVLIPYYMADLVDYGIEAGDMAYIKAVGFKLILFALLSLTFGILGGLFASRASAGFASNLQHDMYYHIQEFSFSNIDKFSTAGLVTRMTTDVTNVQQAFMMVTRMAFRSPCTLIFALVMAFRKSARLSLVFVAVLPVLAIGLALIMTHSFPIMERVFGIYDKLNAVVQENLRGIRVVKAFVREEEEKEKFQDVSGNLYRTFVSAERIIALNGPLMQTSMYVCMLLISWFGAKLVVTRTMSTGQLMAVMTYVQQILMSLMMLSMIVIMLTIAKAAAQRICAVLDEAPDIVSPENAVMEVADGSVRFEGVSFGYGSNKHILKDISFDVASGETIGIIGGTGAGKSSMVQLIPRLYDVRKGSVTVSGIDVRDYDLTALRSSVAMVLQKNVLFSGSVKDNIRWGKQDATDEEIERACRLAQAEEFIKGFPDGYDTWIEQGGSNVSGGQRQRLCIARALIAKPKILILDDSTSAVDTHTESLIRAGFAQDIPDTTIFIIAQRISSVKDADRIIVLDDGRISGIGTHDELLASNEIYQEVYESQTKGGDFDEPGK